MPEMIPLGWFHTIMGIIALVSGIYTLYKYKEIKMENRSGLIYLIATLITAATALMIFQHGAFGPPHGFAVLTLGALAVGTLAAKTALFGRFSRYLQGFSYTAALLFHGIPAVSESMLRLPPGDPIVDSFENPILGIMLLSLVVIFLVGVSLQLRWISKNPA
ncbi:MAG: hypothetical protein WBN40_07580 [Pseudomonadales bacterium]